MDTVRVLAPSGMLGAGWDHATVERGIALGADVISVDGGSTDSGPYYLGAATAKTTAKAVARDLRSLFTAAAGAGIPVVVGSCGTSGTDTGVDWVAGIAAEVLAEEGLELKVARIYSEQDATGLKEYLDRDPPVATLGKTRRRDPRKLHAHRRRDGPRADRRGAARGRQVVLAGRATDTAVAAAYPLMMGMPAGPTLARRQGHRMRRAVHQQPARWRRPGHDRRGRLHHRAARPGVGVHADLGGRAHALRDGEPASDAGTRRHPRRQRRRVHRRRRPDRPRHGVGVPPRRPAHDQAGGRADHRVRNDVVLGDPGPAWSSPKSTPGPS